MRMRNYVHITYVLLHNIHTTQGNAVFSIHYSVKAV